MTVRSQKEREPTGLAIMQIKAVGQYFAQALDKSATMLAFVLNKSSRVIPELQK